MCQSEALRLEEEFVLRKSSDIKKTLTEGIAITNILGLKVSDEALFYTAYQRKLYSSGLFAFEPRPYVISALCKIAKVASKLSICAPKLKDQLVSSLVSKVLKAWTGLLEAYKSDIDRVTGVFLWVDTAFCVHIVSDFTRNEQRIAGMQKLIKAICGDAEKPILRKSEEAAMKSAFAGVCQRYRIALQPLKS